MYRKDHAVSSRAGKKSPYRRPLILQGARQVGKTYALLEFGKAHYENVAYFNFETNPSLASAFRREPGALLPGSAPLPPGGAEHRDGEDPGHL